jgi:cytochrome P450
MTQPRKAPPSDPLLGHLRYIRADAMGFYLDAFQRYGNVVRLLFGRTPMYLFAHPDDVKYILHDNPKNFEKRSPGYTKLRKFFGEGLVTSDGDEWRRQRKLAQPAFHKDRIKGFVRSMTDATTEMLATWKKREGTIVDVSPEMMNVTQRIVSETLLGTDAPGQAVGDAVAYLLADIVRRQTSIVDLPLKIPTRRNRRFQAEFKVLNDAVFAAIYKERDRAKRADAQTDAKPQAAHLLAMLVDARDEDDGNGMTDEQLRDQVLTLFVAGHETSANGLVWTLYFLSLHPKVRTALREEVRAVLGGRVPEFSDLAKMPLLERVVKESMRLKPPITRVGRRVAKDDVIGGQAVRAGDYLVVAPYVTHRHPDFWDDPETFDPDRFLPEREEARPRYAYFPFLGGPRQCIGNVFAMTEMMLIVAMIVARYDLDLLEGHPVVHEDTFSLRQRYGMRLHLRPAPAA